MNYMKQRLAILGVFALGYVGVIGFFKMLIG